MAGEIRRRGENESWLDLVAELAADQALATLFLHRAQLSVGRLERTLHWPRLITGASTPDAVFFGDQGVIVVEAKRPDAALKVDKQTVAEVLVRIANAHFLAGVGQVLPRVLVVGGTEDAVALADVLAERAFSHFEACSYRVETWSKNTSSRLLFGPSHEVSKAMKDGGVAEMRSMLTIRTYHTLAAILAEAATELQRKCPPDAPQKAAAYRALRLRAAGFGPLRDGRDV
jgi:hypothetical protein